MAEKGGERSVAGVSAAERSKLPSRRGEGKLAEEANRDVSAADGLSRVIAV